MNRVEFVDRLRLVDDAMPPRLRTLARTAYRGVNRVAENPRWGSFLRAGPLSVGNHNGASTPIDQFYVSEFVDSNVDAVRGRVLAARNSVLVDRVSVSRVSSVDVFDIDPYNVSANILTDLCDPVAFDPASYDCIVMTQTIQRLADPELALKVLWQALRPGGTILLSSPVIGPVDPVHGINQDLWRYSSNGLRSLVTSVLPDAQCSARDFGSLATAIGFLAGIPTEKMPRRALSWHDERTPVVACARLDRPLSGL